MASPTTQYLAHNWVGKQFPTVRPAIVAFVTPDKDETAHARGVAIMRLWEPSSNAMRHIFAADQAGSLIK
jgi:hypothetical protein